MDIQEEKKIPKVSVCVVTYNQEKYIAQCLQSAVDQKTDFEFEIIVSDDCSTDSTRDIVKEFAEKYPCIIPVLRKKNIGAFKNFVDTHNMAKGEYVCHLDGDDYWLPGKLNFQAKILDERKEIVQCWTCANLVDDDGQIIGIFPSRLAKIIYPQNINAEDIALSYSLVGHHSTQMYRRIARKCFSTIEPTLDYWIAFTIALSGPSHYSKSIYSSYRVGSQQSITRTNSNKKIAVDVLSMHLFQIINFYPKYSKHAKANLIARKFFSSIVGHDLSTIDLILNQTKCTSTSSILIVKSLWFFLLQKI